MKTIDLPGYTSFGFHPLSEQFFEKVIAAEHPFGHMGVPGGMLGKEIIPPGTLIAITTGVEKAL